MPSLLQMQVNPPDGTLAPYEACPVEFTFSPVFEKSALGWSSHQGLSHRRDYAMFVLFIPVGGTSQEGGKELRKKGRVTKMVVISTHLHFCGK